MWPINVSVTYTPVDHIRLKLVADLILSPYKFEIYLRPCIQKRYILKAGCVTFYFIQYDSYAPYPAYKTQ